jgi:hypothetical protein
MKITPEILKYARGELFSNNLEFRLERTKYEGIPRVEVIVDIVRDLNVIHVGCSDHVPLIREKIRNNKWLHKLITENAQSCIGVDNDRESIQFITNELGFSNVRYGDIMTDTFPEIDSGKWDIAVFGEMIEHLGNPVDFLSAFRSRYGEKIRRFLISVPNIYNRSNLKNMYRYQEVINSDHRFWFTPYTIIKVLAAAGFIPETIEYANLESLSKPELVIRKLRRILHIPPLYPFYYFKNLIITGTRS